MVKFYLSFQLMLFFGKYILNNNKTHVISICGELCSCPGKFHAFYWSLIPHGQQGLTREDLWFTCCILRSNLASQLNGGLSLLTKHVVSLFEPLKTGLVLSAGDQSFFSLDKCPCCWATKLP